MSGGQFGGQPMQPMRPPTHTGGFEPLAMLQAFRSGQPLVNPTFQRPAQFLPQALPTYTPRPVIAQAPVRQSGLVGGPMSLAERGDTGGGVGGGDGDGGASAAGGDGGGGGGGGGGK